MKILSIQSQNEKLQLVFELPCGYGYNSILDMAQYLIDYYLVRIISIRTCLLMGYKEYEYRFHLLLRNNRIRDCKALQKEQGVLFLKGTIKCFERCVEFVWFNQTRVIGVLISDVDNHNIDNVSSIIDDISSLLSGDILP